MSVQTLRIKWPIVDPDMPLSDLRAEAIECLQITAATHGWTYVGAPMFAVRHGERPKITATVKVRTNPAEVAA